MKPILFVCISMIVSTLATQVNAQPAMRPSSSAAATTGPKTLARVERDLIDPERSVLTVERVTSSGTRLIWTYASGEGERRYY